MSEFEVHDSGRMAEYEDGMRRDTSEGKPKFSLLWPECIPYEQQLMYRTAVHYAKGGDKYGDRNWEKSSTPESLAHHIDATERHLHKFLRGVEDGEDHAAAVVWGINAVLLTRWKIQEKARQDTEDEPEYEVRGGVSAYDELRVWVPAGGSVEIDGHLKVNSESVGSVMVFPYLNPHVPVVGQVYGREDTDKMLGRVTAEHSQELDAIQDAEGKTEGQAALNRCACIGLCGGDPANCPSLYPQARQKAEGNPTDEEVIAAKAVLERRAEHIGARVTFSHPEEDPDLRTVHHVPLDSEGRMPCCGKTPFERSEDLLTANPQLVTCSRAAGPMPWD